MMKLSILSLLLALSSHIVSASICLQKSPSEEGSSEVCFPLQTGLGDNASFGEVCLSTSFSDGLKLQVKSDASYELVRNQVWIGDSEQDIPRVNGGEVDLAKFPDFSCDFEGEKEAHWSVPNPCVADAQEANLVVVAHSLVKDAMEQEFVVWGSEHSDGDVPAPWLDVTVNCDCGSTVDTQMDEGDTDSIADAQDKGEDEVICTQDVKECSDGSFVSRVGPNCEFAECEDAVICPQDVKECSDGSFVSRVGPNCKFAECEDESICPQDVKECADGSFVSRVGPNCEFAECFVTIDEPITHAAPVVDEEKEDHRGNAVGPTTQRSSITQRTPASPIDKEAAPRDISGRTPVNRRYLRAQARS